MSNKYYSSSNKKTTCIIRIVCGFLFCLFSITYLGFFQANLLTEKVTNTFEGKFTYYPWLAAILITLILLGLQWGVNQLHFKQKWYAFSYLPSFIILGIITYYRHYYIPFFIFIILGILLILMIDPFKYGGRKSIIKRNNYLLHFINVNILEIIILCTITVSIGNTDKNLHYELAVKKALNSNELHKALSIGKKNLNPSRELTVLHAMSLSKSDKMGELLFEYAQNYKSDGLAFTRKEDDQHRLGFSRTDLYQYLGLSSDGNEDVTTYLKRLYQTQPDSKIAYDYYFSSLLLEKDLKGFQSEWNQRFYPSSIPIPKHYMEALVLYKYLHPDTSSEINADNNFIKKFDEYIQTKSQYTSPEIEKNYMRRQFGDTYWWYYFYQ